MKNIAIAVIDLIFAIKDQDLDKTKQLVSYINENYDPDNEEGYNLSESLVLDNFFDEQNVCLEYVIYNLEGLDYADFFKFNNKIISLIKEKNVNKMNDFVDSQLMNKTYNVNALEFFKGLSRIASINRNYNQLSAIRQKLEEVKE